jgi:phosphoribosylglycinamide formyltransferase-1
MVDVGAGSGRVVILADRTPCVPFAAGYTGRVKSIVILISGRGSNLQSIIERCTAEGWPARIAAVVSNRPDAEGLRLAAAHGFATAAVDHRLYADRDEFDRALADVIDAHSPDLVVLAGFMRILTPWFVRRYEGRMLNVHPSLLPAFPGLHTHRRAIEAGCKLAGATVHFVGVEVDHGPIVMQAAVPVLPSDDEPSLAARVLRVEHAILPLAVRWFVEDKLRIEGAVVRHADGASQLLV